MRYVSYFALFALLAAGCSDGANGPVVVHPVAGKITFDGKPAAGVEVAFLPTDAPMVPRIPRNPHAVTGPDGRFSLTTFQTGDGAAEGGYQIVLRWPAEKDEKAESHADEATETDKLLGWYDGTHSTLAYRVKPGSNEVPTFNLPKHTAPPPVSQGIPGRN